MTGAQQEAVLARGNVIVVAGAGTGKTSTLVERCVALMGEGCSIENILMVTFTDAAAAEMRHRVRLRLAEVSGESRGDDRALWWQEQLALLDTARLCTLHSFCLQLIRENFHLLGLDPTVKILDALQVRPLIETVLDTVMERHYAGTDALSGEVRDLVHRYGQGDADRIRGLVLELHRYAQSLDAPGPWFAGQLRLFEQEEPGVWRRWLLQGVSEWADLWLPEMEAASGAAENLARCARALRELQRADCAETTAAALGELVDADAADWPSKQKIRLRGPFKKFFDDAVFLRSQFDAAGATDGLGADWAAVRLPMRAILTLAQEFGAGFSAAKREAGGIDFADLEQFALRLLWDPDGRVTPVAQQWRAVLAHVFVDECQDINSAQDAILRAVSRTNAEGETRNVESPKGNRFLVGDVKQSIYQFRLARPALFLGYERLWSDLEPGENVTGSSGRRILLSDNFRSAPEVIGFVNALFAPLMRESLGGVDYVPLQAGRDPACSAPLAEGERAVEFHLIPKLVPEPQAGDDVEAKPEGAGPAASEDLLAIEREARLVALRLQELHRSGLQIWDKQFGLFRRVEWQDMAVLLRSPSHRVEAFAQEFHRCGVPLQAARGGFLESTEISDLLSLLRTLDNPLQDIPLLAVLRSPLAALTLDELAEIRIASRERRFWNALQQFHRQPTEHSGSETIRSAWAKVDEFLTRFALWREWLRQTSLSYCLERALADTEYEAVIQSGERGAERVANVRRLVRMVREYDPYQRQGLFRFLRFVDALIESEQDLEPAPVQTQNAVRLMSIHQSKGLEFPVVVVACLGAMFNLGDLHRDVLLDETFGLCPKAVAAGTGTRHPTSAHWLAARRQRRQRLGEELRLFYVAATRARDRLILTATATRKDCEAWEAVGARPLDRREVLSARSPLDWLLLWLPTVTETADWGQEGGANPLLRWQIRSEAAAWTVDDATPAPGQPEGLEPSGAEPDPAGVIERIHWQYRHARAAREPAKTNVTALRRKAAELMDEDAVQWVAGAGRKRRVAAADLEFNVAKIGTLHHQFLQRMSLEGECDRPDLERQLARMVELGEFNKADTAVIDLSAVARFWQSETGRAMRERKGQIRREVPFTARFSPLELEALTGAPVAPELGDEFVVVQGVADLLVLGERELWLLDFKTDHVPPSGLEAKCALYRPQLKLYAAALAAIHGRPVTRCWLHFLRAGETVLV